MPIVPIPPFPLFMLFWLNVPIPPGIWKAPSGGMNSFVSAASKQEICTSHGG
jgi:hypothetical protein